MVNLIDDNPVVRACIDRAWADSGQGISTHFRFIYRGVKCGVLKYFQCNSRWGGYVLIPCEAYSEGQFSIYPTDWDFLMTNETERCVGFSTTHVGDDRVIIGGSVKTADFVADKLRQAIDRMKETATNPPTKRGRRKK